MKFTVEAWAKLLYMRDKGDTEVAGFGVVGKEQPGLVKEFHLVEQESTGASAQPTKEGLAKYFEDMADRGLEPCEFMRVWIHTHPGSSPTPSGGDEDTWAEVFARCDWAAMVIVAKGGQTYGRLRFSAGPGAQVVDKVETAWEAPFGPSDLAAWEAEYARCVKRPEVVAFGPSQATMVVATGRGEKDDRQGPLYGRCDCCDEVLDPAELTRTHGYDVCRDCLRVIREEGMDVAEACRANLGTVALDDWELSRAGWMED